MSTIKLNGTSSGSSIIKAPDSGSTNQTFTLPASSGTLVTTTDAGVSGITSSADATAITIDSSENTTFNGEIKVGTSDNGKITSTFALTLDPPTGEPIVFRNAGTDIARFRPGGGLCFGTDTAAANALDNYEEGTWTPTFSNATKTGGISTGNYIRVGRLCHFQYYTGAATFSNTGGSAIIGGLPFTIDNVNSAYPVFGYVHGNGVLNCSGWHGDVNGTTLYAVQNDSTGYAPFQSGSSKYIMVGGTYIIQEGS